MTFVSIEIAIALTALGLTVLGAAIQAGRLVGAIETLGRSVEELKILVREESKQRREGDSEIHLRIDKIVSPHRRAVDEI